MNSLDPMGARGLLGRLSCMTVLSFTRELPAISALEGLVRVCASEDVSDDAFAAAYVRVYNAWLTCVSDGHASFAHEALYSVLFTQSPFALVCSTTVWDNLPYSLLRAGAHDLNALGDLVSLEPSAFFLMASRAGISQDIIGQLPAWELNLRCRLHDPRIDALALSSDSFQDICRFFHTHGTGLFAQYPGCTWVGVSPTFPLGLRGIATPDPLALEDMVLYEYQRNILVNNTKALLEGRLAANVLLYGDKGTGKSATCKALLTSFWQEGLRIVEVPPANLTNLQELFSTLRKQPCKFIVFVDDLSFADSCPEYTALKTVLEGGLEARPQNVVVYATSNRRNIVRQRFSERQDDVNERDTLEEKFSLADRFDLRLTFQAPSQEEYLHIVKVLLQARGIDIDDPIEKDALAWTVSHSGRSPRVARQFADHVAALAEG